MGNIFTSFYKKNKHYRILMLGLDSAGKTTILYKLNIGNIERNIPTIGFNVETVQYKNTKLTVWDIGGQDKIRPLWKHYFTGVNALIFVIDINDNERYNEVIHELSLLMDSRELRTIPVLIYANKCDLVNKINFSSLYENLIRIIPHKRFHIESSNALNGFGLYEGLDWLYKELNKKN